MKWYNAPPVDAPGYIELRTERSVRERRCPECGGRRDVYGLDPDACDCEREGEGEG